MILMVEDKEIIKNKKFVVLYGAGYYGHVYQHILEQNGIDIDCYVVSDGQLKPSVLEGKEVKFLSSIEYAPEDTVFILTMNQRYWSEVRQQLTIKGYHCVLTIDKIIIMDYLEKYFNGIMDVQGIEVGQSLLDLGILKISNPLFAKFRNVFLLEISDLILPYFNEYTFCTEGPYEIDHTEVQANDVLIDCGANIGVFSTFAAQKGGEVFAFEPVPTTREYLQQNASLYPGKIYVEPYALSDKNGESTIYITDSSGSNTLLQGRVNELDQITVPTITLDQFIKKRNLARVDFIKADIEGAERLMLAGAQETLRRFAPKLAICTYHLPDDKEVLEGLIKQANPDYIVTHRWKKLYAYVPEEKRQQLLQENAVQREVEQR